MDRKFMKEAICLANQAKINGEVPVGAVIVKDGQIIATGRNMREEKQNALSHAEIEAINNACKALDSWRLDGCEMYVTLEPCPMCAGAIINARIKTLIFGAYDKRMGSVDSVVNLCDMPYNHKVEVYGGIMEDECLDIIKDFFKSIRD
ncbi:MAG: nucleoside deaminase [Clostridia bacterium]|nr:nucleoside deaminase [Clostridia bacterium]MBR4973908.1 nucleoside deaminase [Clostridia bacterium]